MGDLELDNEEEQQNLSVDVCCCQCLPLEKMNTLNYLGLQNGVKYCFYHSQLPDSVKKLHAVNIVKVL